MKLKIGFLLIILFVAFTNISAQSNTATKTDKDLLDLPGDNLDLYAVLKLFQESKTIEDFEKSLNEEKTGINNLDLNLDGKVDFIKIKTTQEGTDFIFILQVDVLEGEVQDVAVILVSKDKNKKVTIQIIGDESLYGKDYVIEPNKETPAITANPAYSGPDTVVVETQAATVVVIESEPIVQYVYSPVYVPYYPPYHYGYYPVYYTPYPVISINIYFGRHRHHHHYYHGGRNNRGGNTIVINNRNYNNYSRTRNTSNTVNRNKNSGSYKRRNTSNQTRKDVQRNNKSGNSRNSSNNRANSTKPSNKINKKQTRPSSKPNSNTKQTRPSNKPSSNQNKRQKASQQNRQAKPSSTRQKTNSSTRRSGGSSKRR